MELTWLGLGTTSILGTGFASTRYQLAPCGDTNKATTDSHVMARVGDSEVYMTDGVIAHMMIEGTMIELSR
jgi:hypothetical protein